MKRIATYAAPAVVAALLAVGPAGTAVAEEEPCSTQQTQVTRAEGALARVTAVFERQQTRVKAAKKAVEKADTRSEKAKAAKGLAVAQEKKDKAKAAKKAQKMRLQKAQQRLDNCLAAQEPEAPTA